MNPKAALRQVRLIHGAFLTTMFLYVVLLNIMKPIDSRASTELMLGLAVLGISDLSIAFFFRSRRLKPAEEKLRLQPDNAAALNEWRTSNITCFVFAETVALFGFVTRILGAEWKLAAPFFVVAALLLLLWAPRLDVPMAQ